MNKLTKTEGKTIKTINRSHIAKKVIFVAMVIVLTATIGAVTAHADGFTDAAKSKLTTIITMIGGGVGLWGIVNLLEGYGSDNPGAKSQGIKQVMAGAGLVIASTLVNNIKWG